MTQSFNIDSDKPRPMDLLQARRVLSQRPDPHENYMQLTLPGAVLIVPFNDGKLFIDSMRNAEQLKTNGWNTDPTGIFPLGNADIVVSMFSRADYERYKLASIMGMTYAEVVEAEKRGGRQGI